MIDGLVERRIKLEPYTRQLCHQFYQRYVSDPLMTEEIWTYAPEKVDTYFDWKVRDPKRRFFAILYTDGFSDESPRAGEIIGEIQLKRIDPELKQAVLSIILRDDGVKNRGFGTEAEQLIVEYARCELGLKRILTDTTIRNKPSQAVLSKLGFRHLYDENRMRYYCLDLD